jgi:hypothetical protein
MAEPGLSGEDRGLAHHQGGAPFRDVTAGQRRLGAWHLLHQRQRDPCLRCSQPCLESLQRGEVVQLLGLTQPHGIQRGQAIERILQLVQ